LAPHVDKSFYLENYQIFKVMRQYPSDLTNSQWQVIKILIDNGRKRKYSIREIMNAILYITKSGCQWRMLPLHYPPWKSVYYYFHKWSTNGLLTTIHDYLVKDIRIKSGREPEPSVGIIDSQTTKASNMCQDDVGYDGGKKIKGRKRHIVVDTMGLLLSVIIHPANIHDSQGVTDVLWRLKAKYFYSIQKIIADGGYRGDSLASWIKQTFGWMIEIVLRSESPEFEVLPKRWIVERTFAWISFQRRMSKDYERSTDSSYAFVQLSMIRIMLNRYKN
jgi:putative transposase